MEFKAFYIESVIRFIWRQWSCMGAAGGAAQQDNWAVDPEALLVFSLGFARYEPRLFDETLDWLVLNGRLIDIQRLRSILKNKPGGKRRLAGAAARYVSLKSGIQKRKWEPLSNEYKPLKTTGGEILFLEKDGALHPRPAKESPVFRDYGFIRDEPVLRNMSGPAPANTGACIRFLLRSLFGTGSRSECVLYLLTHDSASPSETAAAAGISKGAVQNSLAELSGSGMVCAFRKGKRAFYSLPRQRWWNFLAGEEPESRPPEYLNWISLFGALDMVFLALSEAGTRASPYMRSSKLRSSMAEIFNQLSLSGISVPVPPGRESEPAVFEEKFKKFVVSVLGII